jgi:glutathione synthase/RimK-type ligase-like ATP-grasp enzyme
VSVIAVHGTNGMARRWPVAAESMGHECRVVNGYATSIIAELRDCDAFLWHVNQSDANDLRFARSVLLAAASMGLRVYPDHDTVWHFDDKVAQKYVLEAIGAPFVDTWVFFDRDRALDFLSSATYPLVFKLRRGAASLNVRLVRSKREGAELVSLMFGRGLSPYPVVGITQQARGRAKGRGRGPMWVLRNAPRVMRGLLRRARAHDVERGYVMFQRYIPGNDHDVRVIVVGARAFVWRRDVRPGDFRASGSGRNVFLDHDEIDTRVVEHAFRIARDVRSQSLALDFVYEPGSGEPVMLEISFAAVPEVFHGCKGYFDERLEWHPGAREFADLVLEDLLGSAA